MARLQLMHLPVEPTDGVDRTPYLLIVDDLNDAELKQMVAGVDLQQAASECGARAMLAFPFKVEVF